MAEEFLRIGGRYVDTNGNGMAKAINTDANGNMTIQLVSGKHEYETMDKDSHPSNESPSEYELRDTDYKIKYYTHSNANIFEQGFIINNSLDAYLRVVLSTSFRENGIQRDGFDIYVGTIPAGQRYHFFSDTSSTETTHNAAIIPLADLRIPHQYFKLMYRAMETPTSGQVIITNVKRY